MPSHIHLIARTEQGNLSDWVRDFKGFTSRRLYDLVDEHNSESRKEWLIYMFRYFAKPLIGNKDFKVWKQGNHPVEVLTEEFYQQKEMYIHNNPVEAGLVTDPEFYTYSSANPNCAVKISLH